MVTLVAAVRYFYLREFWVLIHGSPILYRSFNWAITVPLLMFEVSLILAAVQPSTCKGMVLHLLFGPVAMRAFGYLLKAHLLNPQAAFVCGLTGWAFILL